MYEAFGRGDVQAIVDRITNDVDWSTDAAIPSRRGTALGTARNRVVGFFEAIGETRQVTEFPAGLRQQ